VSRTRTGIRGTSRCTSARGERFSPLAFRSRGTGDVLYARLRAPHPRQGPALHPVQEREGSRCGRNGLLELWARRREARTSRNGSRRSHPLPTERESESRSCGFRDVFVLIQTGSPKPSLGFGVCSGAVPLAQSAAVWFDCVFGASEIPEPSNPSLNETRPATDPSGLNKRE
jgi:hypothetical protein